MELECSARQRARSSARLRRTEPGTTRLGRLLWATSAQHVPAVLIVGLVAAGVTAAAPHARAQSCEAHTPLGCGEVAVDTIDIPGDVGCYSIDGTTGEQVRIQTRSTDPDNTICWDLYNPSGSLAASLCQAANVVLSETGTWTIEISEIEDGTGGYSVRTKTLPICGDVDPFLCHRARATTPLPEAPMVDIATLFEDREYDAVRSDLICNPAAVDGATILDGETHLKSHRVRLRRTTPKQEKHQRQILRLENATGEVFAQTIRAGALLVPASKGLSGPLPPPDPGSHDVDHYKCYFAQSLVRFCEDSPTTRCNEDADCFAAGHEGPCNVEMTEPQVLAQDPFLAAPTRLKLRRLTRVCAPADKNDEGIKDPDTFLTCYSVMRVKKICTVDAPLNALQPCKREPDCGGTFRETRFCNKQEKAAEPDGVYTVDQFGTEISKVKAMGEICLPASRPDGAASNEAPTAQVTVDVLDPVNEEPDLVELDGTRSEDRDGAVVAYDFRVRRRDTGEIVFDPPPGPEAIIVTPEPGLFPDDYEAELVVVDDRGEVSALEARGFSVK